MMITDWVLAHFVYKEIIDSFYKVFKLRKLKVLAGDNESSLIKYNTQPIDYKKWKLSRRDLNRVKQVIVSKGEYTIVETSDKKWVIEKNELIDCSENDAENTFIHYLLHYNTIA